MSELGDYLSHRWTLAAVPIPAAAEDTEDTAGRNGSKHAERIA